MKGFSGISDENGDGIAGTIGQNDESHIIDSDDFAVSVTVPRSRLVADDGISA